MHPFLSTDCTDFAQIDSDSVLGLVTDYLSVSDLASRGIDRDLKGEGVEAILNHV